MERVNFHLTEDEIQSLEAISDVTGMKKAELIRRAVDQYIDKMRSRGMTGIQDMKGVCA